MNNGGGLYCVEAIEHPASRKGAASSMAKIIVIPEDSQLVAAGTPGRSRTRVCEVFCGSRDGLALEPVHATSNYAHDAPRQTEDDERNYQDGKQSIPVENLLDVADLPRQKSSMCVSVDHKHGHRRQNMHEEGCVYGVCLAGNKSGEKTPSSRSF
jgi:hypothetical protein